MLTLPPPLPCSASFPGHAGKSHSLGVALRGAGSVLCVPVPAGASHDHVVAAVRNAVVRSTAARADCMERVLRAHRHLFGSPVTVVLQPAAWADGLAPAAVVPGGLDVARLGTLYVVIDADPDALDARMVPVLGRRLVVLQPMRRWQIEALPGLRGLHVSLALAGLDHAVWAVLSGNPGLYRQLDEQVRGRLGSDGDVAPAVESFLRSELAKAVSLRSHALAAEPRLRGLLHSTVADKGVAASALEALSLPRHGAAEQYASQLFQVVEPLKDAHVPFGTCWLVPASPAVAAVLRHGPAVVQLPWAELKASLGADAIAGRAGSCRLGNDDWGARANLPPVCDQMDYLVDYR